MSSVGTVVTVYSPPVKHWWQTRLIVASITCSCGRKAKVSAVLSLTAEQGLPTVCCSVCMQPINLTSAETLARVIQNYLETKSQRN